MIGFAATMPAAYERLYSAEEVAEHAAIVSRRAGRLVHAEVWRSPQGPVLCVVAEDRPGFLALVTDTLLAQGLAIQGARAFCREVAKDRLEAVDFLQLHALGGLDGGPVAFDDEALPALIQSLTELMTDEAQRDAPSAAAAAPSERTSATRVYFEREPPAEGRYLLVVEAPDSDGLLHAISSALHAWGVRIMACEIRTVGGRALDRFEVEPVSRRFLPESDLCDVQLAVLDALPSRR